MLSAAVKARRRTISIHSVVGLHPATGREGKLTALDVPHTNQLDQEQTLQFTDSCLHMSRDRRTQNSATHHKTQLGQNVVVRIMKACMCVFSVRIIAHRSQIRG